MTNSTHLYGQLFDLLRQYSRASDLRHLKALAWMVSALIYSGQLSLPAWEPYVPSRATKAQSVERRWHRFLINQRVRISALYVPLVLVALNRWHGHRLYLTLDTTVLWDRYCMIHLSVVCCGRAVPGASIGWGRVGREISENRSIGQKRATSNGDAPIKQNILLW